MTQHPFETSTDDEPAVRDLVARASRAQADADVLPTLHTVDAVVVNIAGRRVLGRAALAAAMTAALDSALHDVRTSVEVVDVRFPGPDVAVVSCLKSVHDERVAADRTALPDLGALTYVMTRQDGAWRVALAQTTPVA